MVVFLFFFVGQYSVLKLIGPAVWRVANFVPEKKPSVFLAYSNIRIERLCYMDHVPRVPWKTDVYDVCVVVIRTSFFLFLKLVNSSSLCHATKSYLVWNNNIDNHQCCVYTDVQCIQMTIPKWQMCQSSSSTHGLFFHSFIPLVFDLYYWIKATDANIRYIHIINILNFVNRQIL